MMIDISKYEKKLADTLAQQSENKAAYLQLAKDIEHNAGVIKTLNYFIKELKTAQMEAEKEEGEDGDE